MINPTIENLLLINKTYSQWFYCSTTVLQQCWWREQSYDMFDSIQDHFTFAKNNYDKWIFFNGTLNIVILDCHKS